MLLAHLHAREEESTFSVDLELVDAVLGSHESMYIVSNKVEGNRRWVFLQGATIIAPGKSSSIVW